MVYCLGIEWTQITSYSCYIMAYSLLIDILRTWWRHQMETFSALLALCAGIPAVTGEFPSQRPLTRSLTNGRVNNRDDDDLRRHHAHYDVTEMRWFHLITWIMTHALMNKLKRLLTHWSLNVTKSQWSEVIIGSGNGLVSEPMLIRLYHHMTWLGQYVFMNLHIHLHWSWEPTLIPQNKSFKSFIIQNTFNFLYLVFSNCMLLKSKENIEWYGIQTKLSDLLTDIWGFIHMVMRQIRPFRQYKSQLSF